MAAHSSASRSRCSLRRFPCLVRAWVVYPERNTPAPVVLVVHEIFGLSHWVRAVADQLVLALGAGGQMRFEGRPLGGLEGVERVGGEVVAGVVARSPGHEVIPSDSSARRSTPPP